MYGFIKGELRSEKEENDAHRTALATVSVDQTITLD
jgi:hypothetical protein